jgi:uncharacterized protein
LKAFLLPLLLLGSAACDAQAPAGGAQRQSLSEESAPVLALPPLTGRVVDNAGVLPEATEARLTAQLDALERSTTDQLVVVTVPGLAGERIEDLGRRLGQAWGVGRKGIDNGVLMIVAPNERQARIAVGYGLEGLLTDERAAEILREEAIPAFREGEVERGIADGVSAIVATLESDRTRPRRRAKAAA